MPLHNNHRHSALSRVLSGLNRRLAHLDNNPHLVDSVSLPQADLVSLRLVDLVSLRPVDLVSLRRVDLASLRPVDLGRRCLVA